MLWRRGQMDGIGAGNRSSLMECSQGQRVWWDVTGMVVSRACRGTRGCSGGADGEGGGEAARPPDLTGLQSGLGRRGGDG